eukprot:Gb_26777 [translate_table: standard]
MESTACENQEEASELMYQNSKVEKSETSHKRPKEQIPSDRNRVESSNIEGHEEQVPKITELDMACTWQTPDPNVRAGGGTLVFDIKTQTIKKLFAKLKKQSQEDSTENTTRHIEEQMPEDEALTNTQPTTNLATGMKNDFSKTILEGLRKLILDDQEEQPLRSLSEADLPGDKLVHLRSNIRHRSSCLGPKTNHPAFQDQTSRESHPFHPNVQDKRSNIGHPPSLDKFV